MQGSVARIKAAFISIPPGPIEGAYDGATLRGYLKFQFHLVRLKVQGGRVGVFAADAFQFHLVRLKDPCSAGRRAGWPISIPPGPIEGPES